MTRRALTSTTIAAPAVPVVLAGARRQREAAPSGVAPSITVRAARGRLPMKLSTAACGS